MTEASTNGLSPQTSTKKLTEDERLRIENYYLKVENIRLQQARMQDDLVKSVDLMKRLQHEVRALEQSLNDKYGVDLSKCKIAPDGTIAG